jgi:myo-inositol-1-phosphate synthase
LLILDSKRAIDEYVSEIMMGGENTLSIYNVCEDSLLATPLIFDLAILAELFTRVQYKGPGATEYESMYSILSLLSNMLKAPLVKPGQPVRNGFGFQRSALINFLRACIGMSPESNMELESKLTW